jgi:hypothetical protein
MKGEPTVEDAVVPKKGFPLELLDALGRQSRDGYPNE